MSHQIISKSRLAQHPRLAHGLGLPPEVCPFPPKSAAARAWLQEYDGMPSQPADGAAAAFERSM